MDFNAQQIEYSSTGYFNKLILDYISNNPTLQPFYLHPVSAEGIKASIHHRQQFNTDRTLLADVLKEQYKTVKLTAKQQAYLSQLEQPNTFTICTAHQPNIFTGPLYFIYKILHVSRLADEFAKVLPAYNFVPVYYMGSEDADLDELGHIYINGEKFTWCTGQSGAVGRMKVDKELIKLIDRIEGQLLVYPFGKEIMELVKACYTVGTSIEQATFKLVNALFADYGLIAILPDNRLLKKQFIPVMEKELTENFSHNAVAATVSSLPKEYKVQAAGRQLNLFYLTDTERTRIEKVDSSFFKIDHTKKDESAIKKELHEYPERFSPNVILRPAYQETILPDIAFVGGSGEIAYWLELKKVFEATGVPYPVLLLRNSFMIICKDRAKQLGNLRLSINDIFKNETELFNALVKRESKLPLSLDKEKEQVKEFYQQLKNTAGNIDSTLKQHTEALQTQALKKIDALEKKMLKAEKKKFEAEQRQLHKLKTQLFPLDNLQERMDNLLLYYAKWGGSFIRLVYENSLTMEHQFTVLTEK